MTPFSCPLCKSNAHPDLLFKYPSNEEERLIQALEDYPLELEVFTCYCCGQPIIRINNVYICKIGPEPNQDMPKECVEMFQEARNVASISKRSAAALLRLCIDKICDDKGLSKLATLNDKIDGLFKACLISEVTFKALHAVRICGNEGVHNPCKLLFMDGTNIELMMKTVNNTACELYTHSKENEELLNSLPKEAIHLIDRRVKE